MNFLMFKQPKGLIKLLQLVFSIIAFSVLVSYSGELRFYVDCKSDLEEMNVANPMNEADPDLLVNYLDMVDSEEPTKDVNITVQISYPFRLSEMSQKATNCSGYEVDFILNDETSPKAIFFVFTAVTSFLFALVMIPVYLFQDDFIKDEALFALIDLGLHVVFLLFWFCGSIAWAAGVANLKLSTGDEVKTLNSEAFGCESISSSCTVTPPSDYGGPVASVIILRLSYMNMYNLVEQRRTKKQHVFIVKTFYKTDNKSEPRRSFRECFNLSMKRDTVAGIMSRFEATGSVADLPRPGRSRDC